MENKTILKYLQDHHMIVDSLCNGNGTCGKCKVKILNRKVPLLDSEKAFLSPKEIEDNICLACFHQYHDNDIIMPIHQQMSILNDIEEKNIKDGYKGNGLIIDIGTTTIVMKWINRENGHCLKTSSFVNPQVSFGGDVISRIHYQNENHNTLLHDILIENLENHLIQENIAVNQMIICGNTTMIHLFLNENVKPLGEAPFHVPVQQMCRISSQDIFKNLDYQFEIITFPHISAFVGGDIVSGIYASDIDISDEKILMVDLGTNGEIVVGNSDSFIVTSTAAGPAFEGVGMSCGGASISGAIDNIKLDPLQFHTIDNIEAKCICGSGYISLVKELVKNKIIDPMGRILKGKQINITSDIYIDQNDISQFQLAKAAIQTGIEVLLKDNNVDTIYIAGGLGNHLDIEDLKIIQVIPDYIKKVKYLGNSALKGCYKLLMSQDFKRVNNIILKSRTINLASYDDFEDILIESLYFYDEDHCL